MPIFDPDIHTASALSDDLMWMLNYVFCMFGSDESESCELCSVSGAALKCQSNVQQVCALSGVNVCSSVSQTVCAIAVFLVLTCCSEGSSLSVNRRVFVCLWCSINELRWMNQNQCVGGFVHRVSATVFKMLLWKRRTYLRGFKRILFQSLLR